MPSTRVGQPRTVRHTGAAFSLTLLGVAPLSVALLSAALLGVALAPGVNALAAQPAPVVVSPAAPVDRVSRDALAASLGVPQLANRRVSASGELLFREYIPAGETFDNWTRMLTVITVRIPDARPARDSAVARLRAARYAELRGKGVALGGLFSRDDPARGPLLYGRFEIGDGAEREHCVTAVHRGGPGVGELVTFARRGRPLAADEVAAVAAVVGIPADQAGR